MSTAQFTNFAKYSVPFKRGNAYYFWKNTGLQNHSVLYRIENVDASEDSATVVLDPNALSDDGTVSIDSLEFSECGSLVAYGLSQSGSDWCELHVLRINAADGRVTQLADVIRWVKFSSIAWSHDNRGFFYCRYPPAETDDAGTETTKNEDQRVYYHVVGEASSEDALVCATPAEREWMFGVDVSDDGAHLVVSVVKDCEPSNMVWLLDIAANLTGATLARKPPVVDRAAPYVGWPKRVLVGTFGSAFNYIANDGATFYFHTNDAAPNYKVVALSDDDGAMRDVVPTSDTDVLESTLCVAGDCLVLCCTSTDAVVLRCSPLLTLLLADLVNVSSQLRVVALSDGTSRGTLPLGGIGSVSGLSGRRHDEQLFYKFISFLTPGDIFRANPKTCESSVFRSIPVQGFVADDFTVVQEFATSRDGTRAQYFFSIANIVVGSLLTIAR